MIPVTASLRFSDGKQPTICLHGAAMHKQEIVSIARKWPGWKALRRAEPKRCGVHAPAWTSALLALDRGKLLQIDWRSSPTGPDARALVAAATQGLVHRDAALQLAVPSFLSLPTARIPKPHQWQAIDAARHMSYRVLLADDMGLGKTSEALWIALAAKKTRMLIITPVSVKWNWQREILATLGPSVNTIVIDGAAKKRANQLADLAAIMSDATRSCACIINYDLLMHLTDKQLGLLATLASGQAVILDESHYVKSRSAKRTSIVRDYFCPAVGGADVRLLCTGTPIRNQVEDLFSQIDLIHPGTWTAFSDFEKRHVRVIEMDVGHRQRKIRKPVGSRNVDALNAVVNTVQIRRSKSILPGLPGKTITYPELCLSDVTKRIYKAMKDYTLLLIDEVIGEHSSNLSVFDPRAKSAIDAAMRCEQIAQGFIGGVPEPVMATLSRDLASHAKSIRGRPREIVFPKAPKLVWAEETLKSILIQGGNPLVLSRFNAPMFWLRDRYEAIGVDASQISFLHGGLSGREKDRCIEAFQAGEIRVLLLQVKMAEGFNLTRSQDVIFFGRDWSPAVNAQGIDRAHRIGQTGTVNVQIPIVRDTVEVRLHKRLMAKDADAKQALRKVTVNELRDWL